jgi:hypothetical protein
MAMSAGSNNEAGIHFKLMIGISDTARAVMGHLFANWYLRANTALGYYAQDLPATRQGRGAERHNS